MNWEKVAKYLDDEGFALRQRAETSFSGDVNTQREMRTRASIFITFAEALRAGTADTTPYLRDRDDRYRNDTPSLCRRG